jgi:hypothetical protein
MSAKRRVYVVGNDKGGVGKSLCAMALLDYLLQQGEKPFLVECDTANPDVWKAYGDAVDSATISLDDVEGWLAVLDQCAASPEQTVVINQGARTKVAIERFGDRLLEGLRVLGSELITLWVINNQRDSLELLKDYATYLPGTIIHVVRNEFFAPPERFVDFNSSKLRIELEAKGGRTLTLPALATRVTADLYGNRRLTLGAAATTGPFGNQIEAQRWRTAVAAVFSEALAS